MKNDTLLCSSLGCHFLLTSFALDPATLRHAAPRCATLPGKKNWLKFGAADEKGQVLEDAWATKATKTKDRQPGPPRTEWPKWWTKS